VGGHPLSDDQRIVRELSKLVDKQAKLRAELDEVEQRILGLRDQLGLDVAARTKPKRRRRSKGRREQPQQEPRGRGRPPGGKQTIVARVVELFDAEPRRVWTIAEVFGNLDPAPKSIESLGTQLRAWAAAGRIRSLGRGRFQSVRSKEAA